MLVLTTLVFATTEPMSSFMLLLIGNNGIIITIDERCEGWGCDK
jgi:hypothetical protein